MPSLFGPFSANVFAMMSPLVLCGLSCANAAAVFGATVLTADAAAAFASAVPAANVVVTLP